MKIEYTIDNALDSKTGFIDKEDSNNRIILIDKPLDWTSFNVVAKVRGITKIKKVGHAGTLDPLATGLLMIATGKMTKKIEKIQGQQKEYVMKFCLGCSTDSLDTEFVPTEFKDIGGINCEKISSLIEENFIGEISQVPPKFSALKVKGKRAYKLAREGKDVKLEPRKVTIKEFELLSCQRVGFDKVKEAHLQNNPKCDLLNVYSDKDFIIGEARVVCSKGTYIRTLADDLGKSFNSLGYLLSLRRTKIGEYCIGDAEQVLDIQP